MRRRLAILLMLIAVPASAATTTKFALNAPTWTDLGAGPMILGGTGQAVFAIGDTTPTLKANEGGSIPNGDSMNLGTTSHVWAMPAVPGVGAMVYVAPAVFRTSVAAPTSVWSASDAAATGEILSNGGLTASPNSAGGWGTLRGTVSKTAGKLYIEFSVAAPISAGDALIGLASSGFVPTNYLSSTAYSAFAYHSASLGAAGSAGFTVNYAATLPDYAAGDVWALAVDFTAGSIWVARNNVWSNSSNPATSSLPVLSFVPATVGGLFPAISFFDLGSGTWTLRAKGSSQTYAPPGGFGAWDGP